VASKARLLLTTRTLVEQTRDRVEEWLERLKLLWRAEHLAKVGLHILMGGYRVARTERPEKLKPSPNDPK
jgi:hypothetical protein